MIFISNLEVVFQLYAQFTVILTALVDRRERRRGRDDDSVPLRVNCIHTKGGLPSGLACGVALAVLWEGTSGDARATRADPPGDSVIDACRL